MFFFWVVKTVKDLCIAIITEKLEEKLNCKYTGLHHTAVTHPWTKVENVFEGENMEKIDA